MRYLYLIVDIGAFIVPFVFSFHPRIRFYRKWKYLWISTLIPALAFLTWDEWFTRERVWGFNSMYLTGIRLGNLPIEEVLFFSCIPYSCVFVFEVLGGLRKYESLPSYSRFLSLALIISLSAVGVLNLSLLYTSITFLSTALLLAVVEFLWRPGFMPQFYISYLVLMPGFFIVNGILTGLWIEQELVWYNDQENLGIRMATIPVEDVFYGMSLLLANVSLLELLSKRSGSRMSPAHPFSS